jgi:hypothetical protein
MSDVEILSCLAHSLVDAGELQRRLLAELGGGGPNPRFWSRQCARAKMARWSGVGDRQRTQRAGGGSWGTHVREWWSETARAAVHGWNNDGAMPFRV